MALCRPVSDRRTLAGPRVEVPGARASWGEAHVPMPDDSEPARMRFVSSDEGRRALERLCEGILGDVGEDVRAWLTARYLRTGIHPASLLTLMARAYIAEEARVARKDPDANW